MLSRLCPSLAIHDKMAHQVTRWAQGLSCLANICRTHAQGQYGPKKERPTPLSNLKQSSLYARTQLQWTQLNLNPIPDPTQSSFPLNNGFADSYLSNCFTMPTCSVVGPTCMMLKGRNGYIKVRMWIKGIPSITPVKASYTNLQLRE